MQYCPFKNCTHHNIITPIRRLLLYYKSTGSFVIHHHIKYIKGNGYLFSVDNLSHLKRMLGQRKMLFLFSIFVLFSVDSLKSYFKRRITSTVLMLRMACEHWLISEYKVYVSFFYTRPFKWPGYIGNLSSCLYITSPVF